MPSVTVRLEAGREWVLNVTRVPLSAARSRDCEAAFVPTDRAAALDVGAVVAECLRNDRGVQLAVVLPNGYAFPTGHIAPRDGWFPMLKARLRTWLATSPEGRVFRCARDGVATLHRLREGGQLAPDKAARAIARLEETLGRLAGGAPPAASDADVAAAFYTWVAEVAGAGGLTQAEVVAAVGRAVGEGAPARVADLDPALYAAGIQRFLDL